MNARSVAPVLKVSNIDRALAHYKSVLGFKESFRVGSYAGITLGSVELHLTDESAAEKREYTKPVGGSTAYVFCDEVDNYFGEIKSRGALVIFEPRDWPYGMRDFRVQDLDGNHLSFGCKLPHS